MMQMNTKLAEHNHSPQSRRVYEMIVIGAMLGGVLRYLAGNTTPHFGGDLHTAAAITFATNVTGSFLIGLIATLCATSHHSRISAEVRQGLLIGFSFLSLQSLKLLQNGDTIAAALYAVSTLLFSIAAAWAGYVLGARKSS